MTALTKTFENVQCNTTHWFWILFCHIKLKCAVLKRAKVYRTFKEVGRKDTLRFQRMGTGKKQMSEKRNAEKCINDIVLLLKIHQRPTIPYVYKWLS